MRTLLVGVVSGLVALVGFAGVASASAIVDMRWGSPTGPDTITASSSDTVTLYVVVTNPPGGSIGYGVSVDYSGALGKLSKIGYSRTLPAGYFFNLGVLTNTGTQVRNMSAAAFAAQPGGVSFVVGTITFHKGPFTVGTFVISPVIVSTDDFLDAGGGVVTGTSIFNSATLINIPEPGTVSLLALGLGGLALAGRRRSRG